MTDPATVSVTILGEEYRLRSTDDPAHVRRVAALLDGKMREVAAGGASLPPVKVAVLAALNLGDEYLKLREECDRESESVNRVLAELIQTLDRSLEG